MSTPLTIIRSCTLLLLISMHFRPSLTMAAQCSQHLAGKRVLVTGAGRGIGQAIAVLCSKEGAKVAISSRTTKELQETKLLMANTGDVSMHVADVTKHADVKAMVESIAAKWGGIDILINNAGTAQPIKGSFDTLASDDLAHILNVNTVAVHRVSSAVVNHMPDGSKIINISSRAGKIGIPNMSLYVASKFALEGLTAAMAEELKDRRIQVNSISPGMVNTRSFPKPEGKAGVRSAQSIQDGLFTVLQTHLTGHYLHVDELDLAREQGLEDAAALKPINEPNFDPSHSLHKRV